MKKFLVLVACLMLTAPAFAYHRNQQDKTKKESHWGGGYAKGTHKKYKNSRTRPDRRDDYSLKSRQNYNDYEMSGRKKRKKVEDVSENQESFTDRFFGKLDANGRRQRAVEVDDIEEYESDFDTEVVTDQEDLYRE